MPPQARLYAVDLPGYGQSSAPAHWDINLVAQEIAAAMKNIDAQKITLIGNCSGALLGILAAREIGDRLERLVLIDPFAYLPWYFKVFVKTSFGRIAYNVSFANPVGRWLTNLSLSKHRSADTDLTDSFRGIDHNVTFNYLAMLASVEDIEQFGVLKMPIDILYGEKTFGAIRKSLVLWRNIWPHANCREVIGAGHLPIMEATARLSEMIFGAIL
jgi:pimeloyl-ACP methyl ester carboxylesterase